ncbi:Receptor-like serine/threonine-protein kinase SD1-8 [Capsicum chinense]|nr:Receptor-like serine/threonine-protein kinase SD1-8 [Capsicum chinense]
MTNINTKQHNFHLCSCSFFFLFSQILLPILATPTPIDTITITNPLTIHKTLVSKQNKFELGFFSPGGPNSDKWYVGIWYKEIKETTIVWVANREKPVTNSSTSSSAVMKFNSNGNLVINDEHGNSVWSSDISDDISEDHTNATFVAQLLDTGNFIILSKNDEKVLWQSFDYPSDTLLPGMKLGWDSKTRLNRNITSWKSQFDPAPGNYTFKLDVNGLPEAYLTNRDVIFYRSGPWNGVGFSGVPEMKPTEVITFEFQMNKDEVYYTFEVLDKKICSRLLVKHNGLLERYTWIPTSNIWNKFWYAPKDQCDSYEECGVSGICNANLSPVCKCLVGYKPKNQVAWDLRDGSDGCVRYHDLDCDTDVFNKLRNMKLPQSSSSFVDTKMNLEECEKLCRYNCSCTAYTTANITGTGSGCVIWTKELVDMRQYSAAEGGQILYVRVASSDAAKSGNVGSENGSGKTKRIAMATGITAGVVIVLIGVISICFFSKREKLLQGPIRKKSDQRGPIERSQDLLVNTAIIPSKREISGETVADEFELPLFDLSTLAVATEDFSDANKLGQGGFGCVYKGIIDDQEIAVKRLSKNSGQGIEEFKNELRLIARLQHRNLVRLLGCCVEMEEKMLIYEYLENKSLDSILFNKQNSLLLDWQRRFSIICGIARGLLYLHQDSRFRIIHRDLKASNILLDKELNPKISDFGMARIFGGDETEGNTKRVVGTYGYMSPEYAMDGLFSVKSDVFSFGVLVLEIVTGKKNRGFYLQNNQRNLLGHAWKLWREGRASELLDSAVGESFSPCEVMRCIHVGLLCVQEQAEDRPNMATVVLMLGSETASMPQPKHPGFCLGRRPVDEHSETIYEETFTVNQVTITRLDPR